MDGEKPIRQIQDITTESTLEWKMQGAKNPPEFAALKSRTSARLAVGQVGMRVPLHAQLRFWADHAAAKDAVESELPDSFAREEGLPQFSTACANRTQYIARPDLGRQLTKKSLAGIAELNPAPCDVCIFLADGLSAKAITQNGMDTLLTAKAGLQAKGISVAVPFVVKNGRVATMDAVSEATGCTVTCVLIGERPGLSVADSMSAYAAYRARVGMSESRRSVISNIHAKGTPAVEAGAWLADLLGDMLRLKCSGIELREAMNGRG